MSSFENNLNILLRHEIFIWICSLMSSFKSFCIENVVEFSFFSQTWNHYYHYNLWYTRYCSLSNTHNSIYVHISFSFSELTMFCSFRTQTAQGSVMYKGDRSWIFTVKKVLAHEKRPIKPSAKANCQERWTISLKSLSSVVSLACLKCHRLILWGKRRRLQQRKTRVCD